MKQLAREQLLPLVLTVVTFLGFCLIIAGVISILNLLPSQQKILLQIHWQDVLVGLTIYLKTSIDFAIFIGNLMHANPGWKKRIAIEIGTAGGNAFGTIGILILWNFFREVPVLMAVMIIIAAFVLLQMAEESFAELEEAKPTIPSFLGRQVRMIKTILRIPNKVASPILKLITPDASLTNMKALPWKTLLVFSMSIPFILGLDDFAGYIPLFSIVNVFGFSIGVLLGHMILNAALFVSPERTVVWVKNRWIMLIGGVAFVGIAVWGFYEALHIILGLLH